MVDERGNVPLPDEITVSLPALMRLFGAIERALGALAANGLTDEHRQLDEALGELSSELIGRLGFIEGDE